MPATLVYQGALSGWTHITVVYENRQPKLYLNGVPAKTGVTSAVANVHAATNQLGGGGYGYYQGTLDKVEVYGRALSGAEVSREESTSSSSASIEWLISDQLGTPRMVIDQTGSLSGVRRQDYLPFGEEIGEGVGGRTTNQGYGQPDGVRNRFTGKERDAETGLDYFMARYLSSSQGRFTSSDPIILSAARLNDPQQLNLYAYTRNNPLKFIDPFGEDIETTGVDLDRQRHAAAVSRQTGLKLKAEGNKVVFDGAAPNRKDLKEAALQIYDAIQSDKVVRIDLVEHDGNVDFGGPFKLDADDNPTTAGAHKIDFGDIDQANGAKLKDFNENTIVLHETLEAIAIQKDGANFDQAHAAANVYAPGLKPAGQGRQVNLSSTFGIILNYIPYEVDRPSGSKLTVTTSVTTLRSTIQAPTSGNLREFMKFRATNPIHIVGVTGKQ
jgi:RHS repeat-associated protein